MECTNRAAYDTLNKNKCKKIHRKAVKECTKEYHACLFLHNGDDKQYGPFTERLETDYVLACGEWKNQEGIYPMAPHVFWSVRRLTNSEVRRSEATANERLTPPHAS